MSMTIGEKINDLRKEKNLTFKELSKKSGISVVTLSNWAKGKHIPQPIMIKRIADALEVDYAELSQLL